MDMKEILIVYNEEKCSNQELEDLSSFLKLKNKEFYIVKNTESKDLHIYNAYFLPP